MEIRDAARVAWRARRGADTISRWDAGRSGKRDSHATNSRIAGGNPIDVAELERAVRKAEPAALLIPPRILRRVIKRDRGLPFLGWHVARRKSYVIARGPLSAIVAEDELGLGPRSTWPEVAVLLLRPDPQELAPRPRDAVLTEYWRILFHARVELAVWKRFASGRLSDAGMRDRIERLGTTVFEEVRAVLRQEGYLLPPRDNRTVYAEFAAVFLELRSFDPSLLPHYFPTIGDPRAVVDVLGEDVDCSTLLGATRLDGAPDPLASRSNEGVPEVPPAADPAQTHRRGAKAARGLSRWLIARAEHAGGRGNVVRAAIDRARAGLIVGPSLSVQARAGALDEVDRLVGRLQAALGFDDREADSWRQALPPLLDRAVMGFWTPEGRLLYDLQKVCLDHEREVFTVDLVEWATSLGRRPVKRPLPLLRVVLISNHLRGASVRLRAAGISSNDRARLVDLIHPAARRAEEAVRDRCRPLIDGVLRSTRILPRNLPETVAYHKLIEELLDRVVRRGFLSLGDLRDACSRSDLKLPDIAGPSEFFQGDQLLETDRALGLALDGVYRRGEVYLRWLQRLSTLAFATRTGRLLTLYVALPYGGAFVILEGLQHLVGPLLHKLLDQKLHLMNWGSVLVIGTLAVGLINFAAFRRQFLQALGMLGRGLRSVLIDLPARLLGLPVIRLILDSRLTLIAWRFAIKPLILAAPIGILATSAGLMRFETTLAIAVVFVPLMLMLNSRPGRDLEEILGDLAVRTWRQLYFDVIPGLFRLVLTTFDRIIETIERLLYAVDEWLRFRSGQRRAALVFKAGLGLVWFVVAYLVRIYVNLLIEPQVNPIKHFPVVTVSHKVILPMSLKLTRLLAAPLSPLGTKLALFIAGTTVLLLPGVFGFLFWELKENWRLYEANRAETLKPVLVGDHGESMSGLLRPGIHSGTLPKLFAKLRKADRKTRGDGDDKRAFKRLESLHHVEESIRRFVDREFIALLRGSRTLQASAIEVGAIHLATNQVRIELRSAVAGPKSPGLWVEFDERHDALIAGVEGPGWLHRLSEEQARVLHMALVGLFKKCGIDWIRATPLLPTGPGSPDPSTVAGIPPGTSPEGQDGLNPRERGMLATTRGEGEPSGTTLLPFGSVAVTWRRWVEAWGREQSGAKHTARFIEGYTILPRSESPRRRHSRSAKRPT